MNLKNKTALVTGASRGIGRAIALNFAGAGANVIVHYNKDKCAAEKTIQEMPGGQHTLIQAKMEDPQSLQTLVDQMIQMYGRIDILVNNAGIYHTYQIQDISYSQWQNFWHKTLSVNLFGAANLSFLIAKEMIKNKEGRIINISSRGAFRGEPTAIEYGASKAGMNAMGQSMAVALAPFGIYVFTIAPGFVKTDMTESILKSPAGDAVRKQSPLERVVDVVELAKTALFLAAEAPPAMTGCIIDVNGASYLRT